MNCFLSSYSSSPLLLSSLSLSRLTCDFLIESWTHLEHTEHQISKERMFDARCYSWCRYHRKRGQTPERSTKTCSTATYAGRYRRLLSMLLNEKMRPLLLISRHSQPLSLLQLLNLVWHRARVQTQIHSMNINIMGMQAKKVPILGNFCNTCWNCLKKALDGFGRLMGVRTELLGSQIRHL